LAIACSRTSRVLWIDARLLRRRGTVIRSSLSQRGRKDAAGHHPARDQNGRRFPTYPETIRNFPVPNVDFSNPTDKARHDEMVTKVEAMLEAKKQLVEAKIDKDKAASGVDGLTWPTYEADLERNLTNLHERVHWGAYRALPSRRIFVPKPDGRQRPLAVAALEVRGSRGRGLH
jgi:hypothetical protein